MAFAPSFGSFGDFLSIALLIKDIIVALDDCRGSSRKHQELRQGLENLGETIRHVEQAYHNSKLVVSNDTSTTALCIISQIHQRLAAFNSQKLQKYATSLSPGGSSNILKDVTRKIQFKFDEKDIENFQREIMGYNMMLTTLMEVSIMHAIQRNNDDTVKQISAIATQIQQTKRRNDCHSRYAISFGQRILKRLKFLSDSVADIHRSITHALSLVLSISTGVAELRSMIMTIEWPMRDEHFVLEDATGRPIPIHLKTVTSWAMFEYILQEHFKGRTGAHRVGRKRYMLNERATSAEIDRTKTWANAFRPYQRIDMSILCKAPSTETDVDKSTTCPFCGKQSTSGMDVQVKCRNCNMFYRRIINLEDEDNSMAAPMPPQQRQPPQFGKPSFGPALPQNLQKKRQRNQDSESESEGKCNECQRPKRSKRQGSNKRKAVDEVESESDEGDYRGLSRIALVSRRKRVKVSQKAFAEFWATDMNGMSFAAYAQKSPPMPGSQSHEGKKLFWSPPDDGWKWPEKAVGEPPGLNLRIDTRISSPRQSEQSQSGTAENDDRPRSDTTGLCSTTPPSACDSSTKETGDDDDKLFVGDKVTSPGPEKSKLGRGGQGNYAYEYYRYRSLDERSFSPRYYPYYRSLGDHEDEDEYVEVDGYTYVIPAISRSTQRLDGRSQPSGTPSRSSRTRASFRNAEEPRRPQTVRPHTAQRKAPLPTTCEATMADARKHRIPTGYSLKNWDPREDPLLLLGSVFDANSLGKWIYDWTVYTHKAASPISEMAGELWLLLIQLAGKIKKSEEAVPRIRSLEDREMIEDFIESGERIIDKFRKLLKTCEAPMIKAAKKTAGAASQLGRNSGVEFVETIFGKERELEKTERFMQQVRLWNMRFDANCENILRAPGQ